MADPTDNQVLLKLLIKGMSPDEVRRLSQETYGQLKTEAAQHIDALTTYYRQSQSAQTDAAKEAAQEKIKAETQALDAVTKLMRQQEVEANRARNAWHGVMEDLENITTVARGAWDVMSAGLERFKALGEEVARTTNIYGALRGSIDEMRKSTEGEVADIDLIEAKNRGFQDGLNLTDKQFGAVAASAHNFAKVLDLNTKEALDKIINSLASGRIGMLQRMGVQVDADKAEREYASSIGKTVDQLTDHQKKNAILQESMRAMDRKMVESGGHVRDFAGDYEQTMAKMQNMHDQFLLKVGHFVESFIEHWERIPDNLRIIIAKIKDLFPGMSGNADEATADAIAHQAERENAAAKAAQEAVDEARGRLADPNAYKDATVGTGSTKAPKGKKDSYLPFGDDGSGYAGGKTHRATVGGEGDEYLDINRKFLADSNDAAAAAAKMNDLEEKSFVTKEKIKGIVLDTSVAYQKLADSLGVNVTNLTHEEKLQALNNEAMVQAEALAKKAKAIADARRAELKSTKDKAGFMGIFLWGTDGPDQTYREMDEFQQRLVDTMGSLSAGLTSQSEALANGIGKGVGAAIAGADAGTKSIRQQTHDALLAMAEQAAGKALWEGAESIASFAVGNIEGGTLHAAAAAAYGGVAVGAGLAARAVGNTPGQTQEQKWTQQYNTAQQKKAFDATLGGGMTTSGSGNQGASGSRSSPITANANAQPIYIQNVVLPGGEASAGLAVAKSLEAYYNRDGTAVNIRTMGP